MQVITFTSRDSRNVRINTATFSVQSSYLIAGRVSEAVFDLSGHPLSNLLCEFLYVRGPNLPASTLAGYSSTFERMLFYLTSRKYSFISAEAFAGFLVWLKEIRKQRGDTPLKEGARRSTATLVLMFMEWLAETGRLLPSEVEVARCRYRKAFRGFAGRARESLRTKAIAPEEYVRLLRAIRLEYECCVELLHQSKEKQDKYDPAFPLLPFVLLLGATLAIRSAELNYLSVGDLTSDRLRLHAPNKQSAELWLPPSVKAALEVAQTWMARYRTTKELDVPLLIVPITHGRRKGEYVRFETIILRSALARFYKKYFGLTGKDGLPILYSLSGNDKKTPTPFSLPFSEFRSAAITEAARHERNPAKLRMFARHKDVANTYKYYVKETHLQWLKNISMHLAPSAEKLRIAIQNKISSKEDEQCARKQSALVPGGHCDRALAGDTSCARSSDCRLCTYFRIHPNRRQVFINDREDALKKAETAQSNGLLRDAQNLREFAALNQAIIDRIDDYVSD
jgi:hypothetical protein